MYILKNIKECYLHIPYTFKHYIKIIELQFFYYGRVKYFLHDLDKIAMYVLLPFLGVKKIKKIHRKWSKHHIWEDKPEKKCNYEEAILDWESAHYTKIDKPLTALEIVESKWKNSVHYPFLVKELQKIGLV